LNSQDLGSISRGPISGSRPTLVPPNAVSKCRVAAARRQCARVVRVGSELDLGAPDSTARELAQKLEDIAAVVDPDEAALTLDRKETL
jgi:hypothetical protein